MALSRQTLQFLVKIVRHFTSKVSSEAQEGWYLKFSATSNANPATASKDVITIGRLFLPVFPDCTRDSGFGHLKLTPHQASNVRLNMYKTGLTHQ